MITVITTIQEPTASLLNMASRASHFGGQILVIGDEKGPENFEAEHCDFYPLVRQSELSLKLLKLAPTGHYSRKNIGYLLAIGRNAECIYDTDDDNSPIDSWEPRKAKAHACEIRERGWVNVYRFFEDQPIWPRGFPLDLVTKIPSQNSLGPAPIEVWSPIQQGLANASPDVDAIWRLVMEREVVFTDRPSIYLPSGAWCPFNSQSTWWFPEAYPLLYLPSHCSFRMTDIWRSFIAQRCLWELKSGLVFHGAEVVQDRNPHDLIGDFKDEIPGYLKNREIVQRLEDLDLTPGVDSVADNMLSCYKTLIAQGYFLNDELELVHCWLDDLSSAASLPEIPPA